MSELLAYGSPHRRDDETAVLGLLVLLGSWTMLFASAFFADGLFSLLGRSPLAALPPLGVPAFAEAVLITGAATLQVGASRIARGRPLELSAALIVALLLGLFFLGLEVVLWRELWVAGVRADTSADAMIYVITGLHAVSVALGVGAAAVLLVRSMDGGYSAARYLPVRLSALYWAFVAVVGLVILALLSWVR